MLTLICLIDYIPFQCGQYRIFVRVGYEIMYIGMMYAY